MPMPVLATGFTPPELRVRSDDDAIDWATLTKDGRMTEKVYPGGMWSKCTVGRRGRNVEAKEDERVSQVALSIKLGCRWTKYRFDKPELLADILPQKARDWAPKLKILESKVLRYGEGGLMGKHVDKAEYYSNAGVMVLLPPNQDCEGGDLVLYDGTVEDPGHEVMRVGAVSNKWRAVVFPVNMLHEVTRVTKGFRYAIQCKMGFSDDIRQMYTLAFEPQDTGDILEDMEKKTQKQVGRMVADQVTFEELSDWDYDSDEDNAVPRPLGKVQCEAAANARAIIEKCIVDLDETMKETGLTPHQGILKTLEALKEESAPTGSTFDRCVRRIDKVLEHERYPAIVVNLSRIYPTNDIEQLAPCDRELYDKLLDLPDVSSIVMRIHTRNNVDYGDDYCVESHYAGTFVNSWDTWNDQEYETTKVYKCHVLVVSLRTV